MCKRKIAFAYAGQGSQKVGMGKDFYENYSSFRPAFDDNSLWFNLRKVCFEGPAEQLNQTAYTQPCMLAFAIGVTRLLYDAGINPQAAAGLSLGEYSALYAAGVFDQKAVMDTIVCRAQAMETASIGLDCAMVAIHGLEQEKLQSACEQSASFGLVEISNYNYSGQMVISGEQGAVVAAERIAKSLGATRCIPLHVSGPFHTKLMMPAAKSLREHLKTVGIHPMKFPVYFNYSGESETNHELIPDLLVWQVYSSVHWDDIMRNMERDGIDTIIEIGPGKKLASFFRRTAPSIKVYSIETVSDFLRVVEKIGSE